MWLVTKSLMMMRQKYNIATAERDVWKMQVIMRLGPAMGSRLSHGDGGIEHNGNKMTKRERGRKFSAFKAQPSLKPTIVLFGRKLITGGPCCGTGGVSSSSSLPEPCARGAAKSTLTTRPFGCDGADLEGERTSVFADSSSWRRTSSSRSMSKRSNT